MSFTTIPGYATTGSGTRCSALSRLFRTAAARHPPKSTRLETRPGCAIRIRSDAATDTVLTAASDSGFTFGDIETDAEFAHVRNADDGADACLVAEGSRLVIRGDAVVSELRPVGYLKL